MTRRTFLAYLHIVPAFLAITASAARADTTNSMRPSGMGYCGTSSRPTVSIESNLKKLESGRVDLLPSYRNVALDSAEKPPR